MWAGEASVTLHVEDHGIGFDLARLTQGAGAGLAGMRERAELLGGSFGIESVPGEGTRVMGCLPVPPPGGEG